MRTGSCTVQQGLTSEAATIVKQAVTLARRRGHAQVTPLHVANTMLAATNGLLRTACLQSHSHPLQCKALELCFNVALNRLPASSGSPMLGTPHSQCPSISNALVAAFKRAQAHQRRGSIENQQQPLLAVKIELEQLIISILDDPSVSRVMREAGFSSPQVKSNVEQAVSLEICSQNPPPVSIKSKENNNNNNNSNSNSNNNNNLTFSHPQPSCQVGENVGKSLVSSDPIRAEDIASVIDNLTNPRKRSTVVVGESLASLEGVVKGVMDKIEKEDAREALKDFKFICLSLSSFGHVSRVEVEQKIEEFKCVAKNSLSKRFILYLGDLKWIFEYRANSSQQERVYSYCPVEHMILEIGKLIGGVAENGRFSVMAIATFQTYMRCKNGHPSLETVWGIHPLTIPACSLRLSLNTDSGLEENQSTNKKVDNGPSWLLQEGGKLKQPPSPAQPSAHFVTEVGSLQSSSTCNSDSSTSSLPAWLQQCKNQNKGITTSDQNCVPVGELCKKWNSMCGTINKPSHPSEKTLTFSSISPSSSTSGFSYDHQHSNLHQKHHFWISESSGNKPNELTLRMYIPEHQDSKQPFSSSNPDSNPNSTSSSDIMDTEYVSKFRELSSENLKTLCSALEKKVPWQRDIIPEIASSILQCRSGMLKRKGKEKNSEAKEETWLFFQGIDVDAKEKIARELAKLVFSSHSNFISISLSSFSSTRADSTEDSRNKRSRDEQSCSYIERFADAVSSNPHRVFLIEDIEQADYCSQKGFKRAIERGRIADSKGEEVGFSDAIIILSCESFSSRSRACSPPVQQKYSHEDQNDATLEETINPDSVSLDLNISIDDEDQSVDDIGLLESVDRRIILKFQEL